MWVRQVPWSFAWAVLQLSWQSGWLLGMWLLEMWDQVWWLGPGLKKRSPSVPITGGEKHLCPWFHRWAPFLALGGFYKYNAPLGLKIHPLLAFRQTGHLSNLS